MSYIQRKKKLDIVPYAEIIIQLKKEKRQEMKQKILVIKSKLLCHKQPRFPTEERSERSSCFQILQTTLEV